MSIASKIKIKKFIQFRPWQGSNERQNNVLLLTLF